RLDQVKWDVVLRAVDARAAAWTRHGSARDRAARIRALVRIRILAARTAAGAIGVSVSRAAPTGVGAALAGLERVAVAAVLAIHAHPAHVVVDHRVHPITERDRGNDAGGVGVQLVRAVDRVPRAGAG